MWIGDRCVLNQTLVAIEYIGERDRTPWSQTCGRRPAAKRGSPYEALALDEPPSCGIPRTLYCALHSRDIQLPLPRICLFSLCSGAKTLHLFISELVRGGIMGNLNFYNVYEKVLDITTCFFFVSLSICPAFVKRF